MTQLRRGLGSLLVGDLVHNSVGQEYLQSCHDIILWVFSIIITVCVYSFYFNEGFMQLQKAIDESIIELVTNVSYYIDVTTRVSNYQRWIANNMFIVFLL